MIFSKTVYIFAITFPLLSELVAQKQIFRVYK